MNILKWFVRLLLLLLYRVEVIGEQHYAEAGKRVLIIANHTSYLDALILGVFLPGRPTFAINTYVANQFWLKPFLGFFNVFHMDPTNPLATKALIRYLQSDQTAVIFPEGRITVTGSLMKVYQGPGLVADKSGAKILPVRINGAQYSPLSRLKGLVRIRWFPKITLTLLSAVELGIDASVTGRARRNLAGDKMMEIMTRMMFETTHYRQTLFAGLLDAKRVSGGGYHIVEDIERDPQTYAQVVLKAFVLGRIFAKRTQPGEKVGVLLPSMASTSIVFFALQACGRVPAMLNFTAGADGLISACETAQLQQVYTSRRFIQTAKLESVLETLAHQVTVIYLEDLRQQVTLGDKLFGVFGRWFSALAYRLLCPKQDPDAPGVVLFTSGSEGAPKGVVLSHVNMQANRVQLCSRIDFNQQDVVLNVLPLFHSFGLTTATLLPMLAGIKVFFYPSPLHYRIVPEVVYDINATILFGTNTFLKGYSNFAHPYDFYSVRYVFAGAEKLQDETKKIWSERFGLRIFEGYGATEAAPALSFNTPMEVKTGSVGRLLPAIDAQLVAVPGVAEGGRLYVQGPNIMLGYLKHDQPGVLQPTDSALGPGWYDTGDIVSMDENGYITILGRAKRFAKVGGEMVSLTYVENLAAECWPELASAAVAVADERKGERVILVVSSARVENKPFKAFCREKGVGEINLPSSYLSGDIPVMGSGKTDYSALQTWVETQIG